jgi:hypothetical protein
MQCAMSATSSIGPTFYSATLISNSNSDTNFLTHVWLTSRQDNATTLQRILCITEHILLALWCWTLHIYVAFSVILKKTRYHINISPLMQPTYTGGHSKFQFLADHCKHSIPVPNVDYITAQCIIMNAFFHACSVQALLEHTLSLKKTQH